MTRPVPRATDTPLGNPDIRVPEKTEKEDRLGVTGKEGEQNANNEERQETEDERKKQSNEAPSEITREQWERKNGDTRALRHVPGGTWLTKGRDRALIQHTVSWWGLIPVLVIVICCVLRANNDLPVVSITGPRL
ncbi:hypothetical protein NDU88_006941 [Pleurodeles waltl]|uniref:Uncharacterized protein n=1 Tax=Pleurodeles waltl TaxID=8319 RepID=A0AAV7RRK8_PLEWA|nr:hypothetical protein NDU88_006941 [Pleurodeles waltl]